MYFDISNSNLLYDHIDLTWSWVEVKRNSHFAEINKMIASDVPCQDQGDVKTIFPMRPFL